MRTIRINIATIFILFLSMLLPACANWLPEAHHIEIQQGNALKQADRDALELGMSKNDVQAILGKAILRDHFHPNRWDYIYRIRSEEKQNIVSRLTLFFKEDILSSIDDVNFKPED